MVFVPVQVPRAAPMVTRSSYKVTSRSLEFRRWPETILSRPSHPATNPSGNSSWRDIDRLLISTTKLASTVSRCQNDIILYYLHDNDHCRLAALTKLIISVIIPIYYCCYTQNAKFQRECSLREFHYILLEIKVSAAYPRGSVARSEHSRGPSNPRSGDAPTTGREEQHRHLCNPCYNRPFTFKCRSCCGTRCARISYDD
jgi:hypothetical protein